MEPVFDENRSVTVPGDTRYFCHDARTSEYTGWSDEYTNTGVDISARSTSIDPGENISGRMTMFTGKGWNHEEDHRDETVYSTESGTAVTVDYTDAIKGGCATFSPLIPCDKWDGKKWVTDTEIQRGTTMEAAGTQRQSLIDTAMVSISLIQLKLQAGWELAQAETTWLSAALDCTDAVAATDTSTVPGIT